jgi:hypothetical protein
MGQGMGMGMGEETLTYEKLVEKAAPIKKSVDPNLIDPNVVARAKELKLAQSRNKATAVDRAAGNVKDDFQDAPTPAPTPAPIADRSSRVATGKEPEIKLPKEVQKSVAQSNPGMDVDGDGDVDRDDVKQILETLSGKLNGRVRGGKITKKSQMILDRLQHPVAGPRIKKLLGTMLDHDKKLRTEHEGLSNFQDEEGALKFLTEGAGMQMGEDGKIRQGAPNREIRTLGGAGMPGEGRGESRAIGFREIQSLLDPNRRQILEDAQNDETGSGARFLHKNALQNDVSWDMATGIYDKMERGMQGKLDGWGKPEAAQGTFTPLGPVEFLKGADGSFTGETNIDALARTDPEEYQKHFSKDNAGNRNRGVFNLMKYLAQGGKGEFTGLPSFFDFDTSTPDHIMGRSSGDLPNDRAKDDPLNLAFDRRGLNQFKVSSQMDGERDTVGSLLNAATKVGGDLGNVEYDEEDYDNMSDSPNFMKYLAYRLEQSDFDPKKIEQRSGGGGMDQYPDSIEDFMNLDEDAIKRLVGKNEQKNPLGLNMRNFSMLAPRPDQRPLVTNTWGGAPGGGLEFNPLTGYRKAMAASALFDPSTREELSRYEEEQSGKKNMTPEKLEKLVSKKRRDLVAHSHFGPQKSAASLYGMGQINTEQFVEQLQNLGGGRLKFLAESHPEIFQQLTEGLGSTLDEYRGKLDEKMPDGPYQFTEDELMPNLDQPYIRAAMGSNYGRQNMPPALIEAFDAIEGNSKYKDNLSDEVQPFTLNPSTNLL